MRQKKTINVNTALNRLRGAVTTCFHIYSCCNNQQASQTKNPEGGGLRAPCVPECPAFAQLASLLTGDAGTPQSLAAQPGHSLSPSRGHPASLLCGLFSITSLDHFGLLQWKLSAVMTKDCVLGSPMSAFDKASRGVLFCSCEGSVELSSCFSSVRCDSVDQRGCKVAPRQSHSVIFPVLHSLTHSFIQRGFSVQRGLQTGMGGRSMGRRKKN